MLALNQPRESMWLHVKFYPPSYPRENPILGTGLNMGALTSRCQRALALKKIKNGLHHVSRYCESTASALSALVSTSRTA